MQIDKEGKRGKSFAAFPSVKYGGLIKLLINLNFFQRRLSFSRVLFLQLGLHLASNSRD